MEEIDHVIAVLGGVKKALAQKDATALRTLSNATIHNASLYQNPHSITLAVLVYTLGKLIERGDQNRITQWAKIEKRINLLIDKSLAALKNNREDLYTEHLQRIRKEIESFSIDLKAYISEVFRKASVNKASKIYEHGISLGQTAQLLGITQWELSEYTGQKHVFENPYNETLNVKERAARALEFFE